MGWLYSPEWPTKAAMIKHLTDPATFSGKATTIAKAVRGNTLWTVIEYTADGASYPKGTRAILCFLLGGDTKRGLGWGYKDMDESMGPADHSCPLKFLDMVPDPGGYATEWRKEVRARAAVKAAVKAAKVGDRLILRDGCNPPILDVVSTAPLRARAADGITYRVPARHVASIEPAAAAS